MAMGVLATPLLYHVTLVLATAGVSASLTQTTWRRAFVVDVAIAGSSETLTSAKPMTCGLACMNLSGCRAFGINYSNATCLLYNHLVEYTTTGSSAPGTRYYWLLSSRCPTEQGYALVPGYNVCLAKRNTANFNNSKQLCKSQGAHLYFADTARKIEALQTWSALSAPAAVWMGAWDKAQTDDWRWLDGSPVTVWTGGMPSVGEHCMYFHGNNNPPLQDGYCNTGFVASALCEIPLI